LLAFAVAVTHPHEFFFDFIYINFGPRPGADLSLLYSFVGLFRRDSTLVSSTVSDCSAIVFQVMVAFIPVPSYIYFRFVFPKVYMNRGSPPVFVNVSR